MGSFLSQFGEFGAGPGISGLGAASGAGRSGALSQQRVTGHSGLPVAYSVMMHVIESLALSGRARWVSGCVRGSRLQSVTT